MTEEEAIKLLKESMRQERIMQNSPSTFFRSSEIEAGVKNSMRRYGALEMAIAAIRAKQILRDKHKVDEVSK